MYKILQTYLILCLTGYASGQTTLSGRIGGMTLGSLGSPYLVTENLLVPANKKITIKAGCVFLFKAFTGITVDGSIEAIGTKEQPIVFTTVNDMQAL